MRRPIALLASILLAAGCGTAAPATPAASPTPTAAPVATPSPSSSPEPSSSHPALSVRVTFDGEDCVYSGPLVIPSPSLVTVTYAPTPTQEDSAVFLFPIEHGTAMADFEAVSNDPKYRSGPGGVAPPFILTEPGAWVSYLGTGVFDFEMRIHTVNDIDYDAYSIVCHTKATTADEEQFPGAIVTLSEP